MKICFVLPQFMRIPVGGYKMVFEYANRLAAEGYDVRLLFLNQNAMKRFKFPEPIRKLAVASMTRIEPRWFPLNSNIKKISITDLNHRKGIDDCDIAVATSVITVDAVTELFPKAKKCYYIQGLETWLRSKKEVITTYALGYKNIVVSEWLKKIVDQYAKEPSTLIKNAIDVHYYKVNTPINERNPFTIGLLYHKDTCKGVRYAMEVIKRLHTKYPDLSVYMFGVAEIKKKLPDYITYIRNATQEQTIEIYNRIAVFLCATVEEGFGLTGLEAMACGAALVSTSYRGVLEYAVDGDNALLSPVKDVDRLCENVEILMNDDHKRMTLAKNGVIAAKEFSWENSMNCMCKFLNDVSKEKEQTK